MLGIFPVMGKVKLYRGYYHTCFTVEKFICSIIYSTYTIKPCQHYSEVNAVHVGVNQKNLGIMLGLDGHRIAAVQ